MRVRLTTAYNIPLGRLMYLNEIADRIRTGVTASLPHTEVPGFEP